MHEDSKILEAEYFLQRLHKVKDHTTVRYELSAFLSAARSALQYAREEAKGRGGQGWYDATVGVDPVVAFLKDTRDINIHDQPVPVRTHTKIGIGPANLSLSGTVSMVVKTGGGDHTVDWTPPPPQLPPLPARSEAPTTTHTYQFKGWPGAEDVITLCTRYLDEIRRIVADGQSRGFLTP